MIELKYNFLININFKSNKLQYITLHYYPPILLYSM